MNELPLVMLRSPTINQKKNDELTKNRMSFDDGFDRKACLLELYDELEF